METLQYLFAIIQAIGAVIGAGGSVVAEITYIRALQDGRIDRSEREHLAVIASALRWGMILLLIGSIGLVLINYIVVSPLEPAETASYWAEMTLALVVITASWALSKRAWPFWLASSAAFTGWWFLAFLTLGQLHAATYGVLLATYLVATAIIAAILGYVRMLMNRS